MPKGKAAYPFNSRRRKRLAEKKRYDASGENAEKPVLAGAHTDFLPQRERRELKLSFSPLCEASQTRRVASRRDPMCACAKRPANSLEAEINTALHSHFRLAPLPPAARENFR